MLQDTNRLGEAEPLLRRALEIDEKAYGLDHPDVAKDLDLLAQLLLKTGRLEDALQLFRKPETTYLKLGMKSGLMSTYGNQANVLQAMGRLEEALALLNKQEAICLELGNKSSLGHCYWTWGLLARAQGDEQNSKQKLEQALALFTELGMASEREAVQAELVEASATGNTVSEVEAPVKAIRQKPTKPKTTKKKK